MLSNRVKNLTMQILADTFRRETLLWKLKLLDAAAMFANAHLHLVQAQTLILSRFVVSITAQVLLIIIEKFHGSISIASRLS